MIMILDKDRSIQKSREDGEDAKGQAAEPRLKKRKQLQKKPNLKVLLTQPTKTHLDDIKSLTDNELIAICAGSSATRRHWQEFNERYTPLINKRIEASLLRIDIPRKAITWDIADEISFAVFEKLCDGKSMKTIARYQYAKAGLMRAVENIVWDWNRGRNLQKYAYNALVQKNITSLFTPLGEEDDDECLMDIIADPKTNPIPDMEVELTSEIVKQMISEIESIKDAKKRLAVKIIFMFHNPLSYEDIEDIAAFQGTSPSVIEAQIDAIVARLADKNDQIEAQQELMANKFADLQKQIARLDNMKQNFNTPQGELNELEKDITRKTKELENLNKRNQKVNVYPTAKEVAELLNLPKAKKKDIAVWLSRFREKIEKYKTV